MAPGKKVLDYFGYIHKDLNTIEFTFNKKNSLYIPLFSASIDHSLSVHILDKWGLTVSSYELARPIVESYLRAMWVKFCLDDNKIVEGCSQLHFPKNLVVMLTDIENSAPSDDSFNSIKQPIEDIIPNMHDFTHGGIQSISRQYSADEHLSNYRCEEEKNELKKLCILISLISYEKLTPYMKNPKFSLEIKKLSDQLLKQ